MKRRVAVCVGINDYPGSNADLSGCVNDAFDMGSMLSSHGYEVMTLTDSGATKANIVAALSSKIAQLKFGDRFVFCYSGHGTWIPDRDGDESDLRDEALCCYDYARGGLLSDDELNVIVESRRAGVRVTIFSDSCHSGTIARLADFTGGVPAGNLAVGAKAKFLPPSLMFGISADTAQKIERTTRNTSSRLGAVLISGCQDHEYSYDASFAGRPNGAMTRSLLDSLKYSEVHSAHTNAPSVKKVYDMMRTKLPSAQYPQTPQLGATTYQKRTALI
jgi:metacaspase-1